MKFNAKKLMGIILATVMVFTGFPGIGAEKVNGAEPDVSVSETYLSLIGRAYYNDEKLVLAWTNSGFSFHFTGTGATAEIITGYYNDGVQGFLNVYVDGALVPTNTIEVNKYSDTYVLAENLENTTHTITVRKRSEIMSGDGGNVQFSKINITDGYFNAPGSKPDRKIEFIGDSITAGYGNMVIDGSGSFRTETEDGTMTYAALTAAAFDADVYTIAHSGNTFCRNSTRESMIDYYLPISKYNNVNEEWDFGEGSDVVVINLGTNDAGIRDENGNLLSSDYIISEAKVFLQMVRSKNPNAVIIWAYGMMGNGLQSNIVSAINSMNDSNMYFLPLSVLNSSAEGVGVANHPTIATDINRSFALTKFIAEKTGWSYNFAPQVATQIWDADRLIGDRTKYIDETLAVYDKAVAAAKNLSPSASDIEVQNAVTGIQNAFNELTEKGDYDTTYNVGEIPFTYETEIKGNGIQTGVAVKSVNFDAIDASAHNPAKLKLQMDMEVENLTNPGDLSVLSRISGQIELTSSGKSDDQELSWAVQSVDWKSGKATYTFGLKYGSKSGDDIDYSNLNYMRIYMLNWPEDFTDTLTIKIDNVKLIDTSIPIEETVDINIAQSGLDINGYQISSGSKGMRTVYTVEDTIGGKAVIGSGIVYALEGYADENDIYVRSSSQYVQSYQSTEVGKFHFKLSDSDTASSYAMTMQFATEEPAEYTAGWVIRGYAQLEDGSYVYTKTYHYTIYKVADYMYQNGIMPNASSHEFLYTDILSIVNKDYIMKEYDWSKMIA